MKRTKHLSKTGAACRIGGSCRCLTGLLLALLVLGGPADLAAQPVEAEYRGYFEQYKDRSWGEAILNQIGFTSGSVGRSFALVAGVSNYPQLRGDQKQLKPAAEDIRKVVDYLKKGEVFDEIVVLQNADMTLDNLRYFLRIYFPDQLTKHPKSRFFFAYSGHGFTIKRNDVEEGYLLTGDARRMTDQVNSVDMSELKLWVDRTVGSAYQSLVLINACHSGAFLARAYGTDDEQRLPSEPGAHVVTASGSDEKSWHDPRVGTASVFFEKFLAGVKDGHADFYPDGLVTVDELITYLRREVKFARPDQSPIAADISKHGSKGGLFFLNRNRPVDLQVSQSLNSKAESFGSFWADRIEGHWVLRRENESPNDKVNWMVMELQGTQLIVSGDLWSGQGRFEGPKGFYDWEFEDGKSGTTIFHIDETGIMHAEVRGSGIDWEFWATRKIE